MNPEITITLPKDQYDDLLKRADIIKEIDKYIKSEKKDNLCIVIDEDFYQTTRVYFWKMENLWYLKAKFNVLETELWSEKRRNKSKDEEIDRLEQENKSLNTELKKYKRNKKWFIF